MKYLFSSLAAILLGFYLSGNLVTNWNPEFHFWRACIEQKRSELMGLQSNNKQVVIFSGGSTCSFSIDPTVLDETFPPSYNFGGAVPMGANYILSIAMEAARPNDTIALALEPIFLTTDKGARSKVLGISLGSWDFKNDFLKRKITLSERVFKRRPGARFVVTLLGRKVMGLPSYRYHIDDLRSGGLLTTEFRDRPKAFSDSLKPQRLSVEGVQLLEDLVEEARQKKVRLVYTIPWTLTDPEFAEHDREVNRILLREIEEFMPVIRDPFYGVHTNPEYFADSVNHLTEEGAKARTEALAQSLKSIAFSN